jgi:hypothetical protein
MNIQMLKQYAFYETLLSNVLEHVLHNQNAWADLIIRTNCEH